MHIISGDVICALATFLSVDEKSSVLTAINHVSPCYELAISASIGHVYHVTFIRHVYCVTLHRFALFIVLHCTVQYEP